jgi:sugar transferase (PEP-CTERM system associated)
VPRKRKERIAPAYKTHPEVLGEAGKMVTPFNGRFALIAFAELLLVGTVFSVAFLVVVSGSEHALEHVPTAVMAHVTFALSLLLPASVCGLHRVKRGEQMSSVLGKLMVSMGLGALLCYAAFALLPSIAPYRASIPDAVLVGALGLIGVRVLVSSGAQVGAFSHRVLVLGTGAEAAAVDQALRSPATRGVSVVGFYQTDQGAAPCVPRERVIADEPLGGVIRRLRIHEIVVAVRDQRGGRVPMSDLLTCRLQGVPVTDLSAVFERVTGAVHLESLKVSWLIYGRGFQQDWSRRAVKRGFDVLAAANLLVLAAPIMLLATLCIWIESGRPVIFRQERIGLNGRTFQLLKFRSMRPDAEKDGVPRWASAGDPRTTRFGRFMRRSRIDELPQIFNILKGEMSFVGPRPERPFFVAQLAQQVAFYGVRHAVKPGLTGWAQVRYSYGASVEDAVRKLEYDLYYVKNHSLLLDLLILLKTVRVVVLGEGAR